MYNTTLLNNAINDSANAGIPLVIKMTSETAPYQFYITLFIACLGSLFALIFVWQYAKPVISTAILKLQLMRLIKNNMMIIKHTESGLFNHSMIDQTTLSDVIAGMQKFKGQPFDLVLYTGGGQVFPAVYIARLLKEYSGKIRAIIPIYSMSGGTILALACDEIYMNTTACLGQVDVQIGNLFKFGSAKAWNHIIKYKGKKADDQSISFALMAKQYTNSSKEFVKDLVSDKIEQKNMNKFVKLLTSGDYEHSYPLTTNLLKEYGLNVKILDNKISDKLLKILSSKLYEGVYTFKYKK